MPPKIIRFTEATKKVVLGELEKALKNNQGCSLPEIPYILFKKAIDSGVGKIASPMRINQEIKDPTGNEKYWHTMCANNLNYGCFAAKPIDMSGNFIEPSEIQTMGDWLREN